MHTLIRPWHTLARNKRTQVPRSIVYLAVTPVTRRHHTGTCTESLLGEWAAILHQRDRYGEWQRIAFGTGITSPSWWGFLAQVSDGQPLTWIVCRDAASVSSWLCLWEQIEVEGYEIESAVIDSLPWIVTIRAVARRWLWCDAANWLPALADRCILPARHQAEALADAGLTLLRWWSRGDLGLFRPTAAGSAWSAYRHRHMSERIEVHGVREVLQLERAAYRGGRCECLYQGPVVDPDRTTPADGWIAERDFGRVPRGPVYVYDIRSAYPAVMRDRPYPCELVGVEESCTVKQLRALLRGYEVIAQVELQASQDYPVKGEDGRICYCRGHMVTTLAGPELARAFAADEVRSVGRVAWYRQAVLFRSWVDWLERELSLSAVTCALFSSWIKQLGRCLYGRFGMGGQDWLDAGPSPLDHPWGSAWEVDAATMTYRPVRDLAGHRQRLGDAEEGADSFPAIPAYVTSYLRVHLAQLLALVGHRNCYYYDTDELHVDSEGQERLEYNDCIGSAIGQLKLKALAQDAEYWGPRHYRLGETVVWAGVSGSRAHPETNGIQQTLIRERTRSVLSRQLDGTVRETWQPIHPTAWEPPAGVDDEGWVRPIVL